MTRKELFKHSLIKGGIMPGEFARMLKVSPTAVFYALKGNACPKIDKKINKFINLQIPFLIEELKNFQPIQ
ncbi:unnamed protein product [marine sediment metagenome]|uniref:Uncharacterized protein n=1 Tax=marine sediment metagenome TaxID=412755 RepID=X1IC91_9ZZZZ